jgi:superfamily II DNA or RNA helicase/ubiquinone/menaquinone biosynthesis C-methylase UbiE|tara:strand:- start:749 stop:3091 length:2343 start_codon:yes stop_codon:yes gene_type:complete
MLKLRPYQVEAVKEVRDKKRVIIADDMGFGKTAEAIVPRTAIENKYGNNLKTIVICPASVMPHWENEFKKWYKKKGETSISNITTSNYDQDIEKAKNSDVVVISYPTLSNLGGQDRKIQEIRSLGFSYGIIDEAQNAKNPESIRSNSILNIFDSAEYLSVLSGTPIPNNIVDIYIMLHLLDKRTFPINSDNPKAILSNFYSKFKEDPEFIRRILQDRMIRRKVNEGYIKGFPHANNNKLEILLENEHRDVYMQVYENDNFKPGQKLTQLRYAVLDPNLVDPQLLSKKLALKIGKMNSSVYDILDKNLEEIIDTNGKALIFSDLKVGVTAKLQERYKKYGALLTDGDNTDLELREETRRKFQKNKDNKILIATTVMDEGVDLTAATDVIHLPPLPYTPATIDQRNRRAQRVGEIEKDSVNIHTFVPRLDTLTPTISEGILNLINDKRRIINYLIEHPDQITKQDLDEIKNGSVRKSRHISPLMNSPKLEINNHLTNLKAMGSKKISEFYKKNPEQAEYFSRLYARNWEGNYGGNTSNLYKEVIKVLEEKGKLKRKLDIASGPFSLSRTINESVINLDINPYMLKAGEILEKEKLIVSGNNPLNGSFTHMPLNSDSFDLAVCSLALHMSKLDAKHGKERINERERVLREMNRVLKKGSYGIVTLPHTLISEGDLNRFYSGLGKLGFQVLPFSGFYRGPKDTKYKGYIAGLKKIKEPVKKELNEKTFVWDMDRELIRKRKGSSSKQRKHAIPKPKEVKREVVNKFFNTRTKKSLADMVRSGMK